jgi:hypothetical protein
MPTAKQTPFLYMRKKPRQDTGGFYRVSIRPTITIVGPFLSLPTVRGPGFALDQ